MSIREKGYHGWDGELKKGGLVWLPIFLNGIKTAFRKKHAKAVFIFTGSSFLFFLFLLYASANPQLKMLWELVKMLNTDARFFSVYFTNGYMYFWLILMSVFIFSDLISGDLRFNAFPLYFSRPLNKKDYITGKFAVIMFYLLLFTLVPGILLLLFKFIFTGEIVVSMRVVFGVIIVPILYSTFFASLVLMVSSLNSNSKYVKIMIFLVFFIPNTIGNLLREIFKNTYFNLFAFSRDLEQMGAYIFGAKPVFSVPGWMSLAIILGIILFSFYITFVRIGKSEAQIEIGS